MSEGAEEQGKSTELIFKLDSERRREIDGIKTRMEEFLRAQIDVSNELKLVVKGQDSLRERFEVGTAGTLRELKSSFDQFRVEWGQKMAEDSTRDKRIDGVEKVATRTNDKFDKIIVGIFVTVFCSVLVAVMVFLVKFSARF